MNLGKRQREMLAKICKTNGGGISVPSSGPELTVIRRLEELELIQGKLNHDGRAVHTQRGLKIYRELVQSNELV